MYYNLITDDLQGPVHARKSMVKAQSLSKEQTQSVSFKTGGRSWNGHYCCVPGCKNSSSDKKMQDS